LIENAKKYVTPRKNAFNENEEKQGRSSSKRFLSPAAIEPFHLGGHQPKYRSGALPENGHLYPIQSR